MNTITLTPEARKDWPEWAQQAWELESHRHGSITPLDAATYQIKVMTTGDIMTLPRGAELTLKMLMGA